MIETDEGSVVIDPYLSNSVADHFGKEFDRQVPVPLLAGELGKVRWVCLTHAHLDHTDPATLVLLATASPQAVFFGPAQSAEILIASGIKENRILPAVERWTTLTPQFALRAVPAAHMALERDVQNRLRYCGYLLKADTKLLYHAGDTIPHEEIVAAVSAVGVPDLAFLPCNERNVYRDRLGIVGNMSVREMLAFAAELRAKRLVALHWDMFTPNTVFPEEVAVIAQHSAPQLPLLVPHCGKKYDFELKEIA
jgi:L-ascorbate metabolism protein UlaG (beta-lactamase superfamily)